MQFPRRNVFSQFGEDGILEAILGRLGTKSGYFVEFGAWDGRYMSNCAKLADSGWAGCFIEGDPDRFPDLEKRYPTGSKVVAALAYVEPSGANSLDAVLDRAGAPQRIDVLSIDINGNDYQVWEGIKSHTFAIVVVEFNPTIPAHVDYVQPYDPNLNFGSSLGAMVRLGGERGYSLVDVTDTNAIFVLSTLCEAHGISAVDPLAAKSRELETQIFFGYNGEVQLAGKRSLVWHDVTLDAAGLQILPEELRVLPANLSKEHQEKLAAYKAKRPEWLVQRPSLLKRIRRRLIG